MSGIQVPVSSLLFCGIILNFHLILVANSLVIQPDGEKKFPGAKQILRVLVVVGSALTGVWISFYARGA